MLARIRKSMEEKDQGFTLIELLVVMIIIGILAAIAIPVFLNQRVKARETSAKADASTIGKEIAAYYVDGQGPLSVSSTAAGGTWSLVGTTAGPDGAMGTPDDVTSTVTTGQLSKGNTAAATTSHIVSETNFCVAVTTSDSKVWSYKQNGLVAGGC